VEGAAQPGKGIVREWLEIQPEKRVAPLTVEREEKVWAESQREGKEYQKAGLKVFVSINYAGNEGFEVVSVAIQKAEIGMRFVMGSKIQYRAFGTVASSWSNSSAVRNHWYHMEWMEHH
jgi:hypothetical protein